MSCSVHRVLSIQHAAVYLQVLEASSSEDEAVIEGEEAQNNGKKEKKKSV